MILAEVMLNPKFPPLFAAATSGAFTSIAVTLSDVANGNGPLAALLVASASILGALFAKLPDIIRARSDSKKIDVTLHDAEQEKLIGFIYAAHNRERDAWERINARLSGQVARLTAVHAVLRSSKHRALNECHRLLLTVNELHQLIRELGGYTPPFTPPDLTQLLRDEDDALLHNARLELVRGEPKAAEASAGAEK